MSLDAALVGGGPVTFACDGTITFTTTKTIAADTSLDATGRTVTLSGNNAVRHFDVNSGVALSLTNLTIANGHTQGANGVVDTPGDPASAGAISSAGTLTAVSCTFSGNTVNGGNGGNGASGAPNGAPGGRAQGGAIMARGGSVTLTNCTFTGNTATGGNGGNGNASGGDVAGLGGRGGDAAGGALFIDVAILTINGTTATSNVAHGGAGGNGQNDFAGSTTNGGNGGAARGGFVSLRGSSTVTNLVALSNTSTGGDGGASGMALAYTNGGATGGAASAGAFDITFGTAQMSNVVLRANSATGGNGGANAIADYGGDGGSGSGGALFLETSFITLVNATVAGNNVAGGSGGQGGFGYGSGGVANGDGAFVSDVSPSFTNTIFWGNAIFVTGASAAPNASHCDIQGGWSGLGTGNLASDPLFVSATNLRIGSLSPCRDTGDNTAASGLTTDIAGDPRVFNSTVDMGAYEYAPIALTSPPGQTVCPGTTVMFTVTVNSGQLPYAYQWRKNTSSLSDGGAISGSQTATLTITGATGANDGSYDVVVSDGSTATQLSVAATLTASDASGPMVTAPADATVTQTTCQ